MYKLVKKIDLIRVIFRGFLIEASWNFEKMQNIGFAYALAPVGNRLYKEEKKAFYLRHLKYYNSHPATSAFVLGIAANLEERMKLGEAITPEQIEEVKLSMMSPLAALGDSIFWEYLRPLSATVGVIIILMAGTDMKMAVLGPIVSLLIYNSFGVFVRINGVIKGYEKGYEVVDFIQKIDLRHLGEKASFAAAIVVGMAFPILFSTRNMNMFGLPFVQSFMFLGFSLLLVAALKMRISPTTVFFGIIIANILITYVVR